MSDDEVTMSKQELSVLQNAYSMLNKLYNHPEKAMEFKKLAKEAGYKVPEIDTIERVTKPYDEKLAAFEEKSKKFMERMDKWENDNLSAKEENALRAELDSIQKKEGFTDEGMKKVIDRMREKNNPDVEAAAAWVKSKEPKPTPTTNTHNFAQSKFKGSSLTGGGEEGEKAWDSLTKNPDDYFDSIVNDVLNNPENSREFGGTA